MSTAHDMHKPFIIGFDGGNKLAKTANSFNHAGIITLNNKPIGALEDDMDLMRMNGRFYCVNDDRLKYERDKTINNNYLHLTLIGIAKELRHRGLPPKQEIVLAAGLPPGHMAGSELRKALREYYFGNKGVYNYQCGGISHEIVISDVVVCPQAYSIFVTLPKAIIDGQPSIHVVDIGGVTVDDVHFVDKRSSQKMLSVDLGVVPLYNKIQAQLSNRFGRKISESQVDDIILGRKTLFKNEHIALVNSIAEDHVKEIFGTFRENEADWLSSHVIFCGGGSLLLRKYIEKYAQTLTGEYSVVEDICANAKGFEVFAEILLRNRK